MARWRLFGRSKSKEEREYEECEPGAPSETFKPETAQEPEPSTAAEYHETLYSDDSTSKKQAEPRGKNREPSDQRIWRNVDAIEDNIDDLHEGTIQTSSSKVDSQVDELLEKHIEKQRKPSNVIYVVSNPQPGEVRGDWAVRGHGKIYSHHKTKEKAIQEARKIAAKREATVMVQHTDGTFSEGFKPKPKQ